MHGIKVEFIYGTSGNTDPIHSVGTGPGILERLKGFRDKFGVPALSNETYVEHYDRMFPPKKAPAPKTSKTVSIMDRLKNKSI